MYDLINSWLDVCNISGSPFEVLQHLTDITEPHQDKRGMMVASGKIKNINVGINPAGIYFSGSLATYSFPSNIYTHTRNSTQQAVESLCDNLHLDFTKAKIIRVDVSTIIPTIHMPTAYYSYLGNKPNFKICKTEFSQYYNNHLKKLIFYDKTIEDTQQNQLTEIDWGKPQGKEVW
jgi:hypothetical protein